MRQRLFMFLLVTATLAACQPDTPVIGPIPTHGTPRPAPGVDGSSPPIVNGAGLILPGDGDAFADLRRGMELVVDERVPLPMGSEARPLEWAVAERDRDKARIEEGKFLTSLSPGGLTLEVREGNRRAWVHCAVRASHEVGSLWFGPHGTPSRAAFPRPLVVRDAETWARVWSGWWMPPELYSPAPPRPGVPAPPPVPPPPPVTAVDFTEWAVLLVDVEMWPETLARPVVTHIEGNVVHLAIPDVYSPDLVPLHAYSPAPGQPAPDLSRTRGIISYAFGIPASLTGVSVRLAPFPEAPQASSVTAEPEATDAAVPFPDASPASMAPPGGER